ncbi:hypothetical protein PHLGIDRAFT_129736 [Phlebiopsis gigantea 11061_1 CR5-6]|uniref:Uncharacterized protein n=1 Tax=Phlebiopsis gigantea (strain 11061_1 CR5-6) TaxID=745531 RepID=A0A0C3RTL3_PHLG1|nr:hypothetical protein PHLGIDRAFT_129736 [Phlebiopsis gigantea 11061_1 CR5-6]
MSKHFCCCIPVRAGVFLFSFLQFIATGFVAAILWYVLHLILSGQTWQDVNYGDIDTAGRVAVGVAAGIYTLVSLFALIGFLGSIARNRRMVKAYSVLTWVIVLIHIVGSGFLLYFAYSGKNLFNGCTVDGHDCAFHFKTWQKVLYTVLVVVTSLLSVYIASVIGRYVDQLYDEVDYSHEYKLAKPTSASTYQPTYYPQQAQEAHQGLLNPATGPYPYSDQAHSFGKHNA